jgi:hypothetical protein
LPRDPFGGLDSYDVPDHDGSASIAGFNFIGGGWHDVERGDIPLETYSNDAVQDLDGFSYHYVNSHGDDVYFHIDGPFETWDDVLDAIAASLDRYGII